MAAEAVMPKPCAKQGMQDDSNGIIVKSKHDNSDLRIVPSIDREIEVDTDP